MTEIKTKECKACNEILPATIEYFMREKRLPDGLENKCRVCRGGNYIKEDQIRKREMINQEINSMFDNIIDQYEYFIIHNEIPYKGFMKKNHIELFTYLVDKEGLTDDDLKNMRREWFQERKLYSTLLQIYNGSIFQFIDAAYPNRIQPWELTTVGRKYWDNKENRDKALVWLNNKMKEEGMLDNIQEIPRIMNSTFVVSYGLSTLIKKYYKNHPYYMCKELGIEGLYTWQWNGYKGQYDKKKDRVKAIRELVEDYLKMDIEDIPKVFSHEYFRLASSDKYLTRFLRILQDYYNFSVYSMINEAYPNKFEEYEFPSKNSYQTLDNTYVRSEPEREIYHLFMELGLDFHYGDGEDRIYYSEKNSFVPDFIINNRDKTVIVEYYGMLGMINLDTGYENKHEIKDEYYKKLCSKDDRYEYIALYKEDLKNNFEGIKKKIKYITN